MKLFLMSAAWFAIIQNPVDLISACGLFGISIAMLMEAWGK